MASGGLSVYNRASNNKQSCSVAVTRFPSVGTGGIRCAKFSFPQIRLGGSLLRRISFTPFTLFTPFIIGAIFMAGQAQVQAQMTYDSSKPFGTANTFNAFIFGGATDTNSGDSDGAVAVGGDFAMKYTTTSHGFAATVGSTTNIGLYVGGMLNAQGGGVNSGANAYANGFTGSMNMNGGTLHYGAGTVDTSVFSSQQTYSQYQSTHLGALTGVPIAAPSSGDWNIDANSSTQYDTLKVFTVNGGQLGGNSRTLYVADLLPSQTLAIDVTGDVAHFNVNLLAANGSQTVNPNQVVWNFLTAPAGGNGNVLIDNYLKGSVLAPYSKVTQSNNIDGILIASTWTVNSGEVHYGSGTTFTGNLSRVSPLKATPEPGTVGLLIGLGISAAAFARRRRKK